MFVIEERMIEDIPSLIISQQVYQSKECPTIVFFHGFQSTKENHLPIAFLLARKGFRVILPDSFLHGKRKQKISDKELQLSFWEIVKRNVSDFKLLIDYFQDKGLISDDRIGIAGSSMGGMTTWAALSQYSWIRAAVIWMGTPKLINFAKQLVQNFEAKEGVTLDPSMLDEVFTSLKKYDLSLQSEKLNQRPILMWHGKKDFVVPIDDTYSFFKENYIKYRDRESFQLITDKSRGHTVSREAMIQTTQWFQKYL